MLEYRESKERREREFAVHEEDGPENARASGHIPSSKQGPTMVIWQILQIGGP